MHTSGIVTNSNCKERLHSKKISNDQELIQADPISCPQNQKVAYKKEDHNIILTYHRRFYNVWILLSKTRHNYENKVPLLRQFV